MRNMKSLEKQGHRRSSYLLPMETALKTTSVVLGFSRLPDAFQRGREAAQMAANQLPGVRSHLVLAFGPAQSHFDHFIEGVRLVTGAGALVGIPAHQALANDTYLPEAGLVVLIHSSSIFLTAASTSINPK